MRSFFFEPITSVINSMVPLPLGWGRRWMSVAVTESGRGGMRPYW